MFDNKLAKGLTGGGGTAEFCAPLNKMDKILGVIAKGIAGLLIVGKVSGGLMTGGTMVGV